MEFCFIRIERVKMELTILKEYQDDTHVGFFNELEEIMSSILLFQNASRYHCLYQAIGSLSQIEKYAYQAFLQPLPILTRIWIVSMDFIVGLPKRWGKDSILVVVDRQSRYAHFLPVSHPFTAVTIPNIYFGQIIKLYGMPTSIMCDRNGTFTSL